MAICDLPDRELTVCQAAKPNVLVDAGLVSQAAALAKAGRRAPGQRDGAGRRAQEAHGQGGGAGRRAPGARARERLAALGGAIKGLSKHFVGVRRHINAYAAQTLGLDASEEIHASVHAVGEFGAFNAEFLLAPGYNGHRVHVDHLVMTVVRLSYSGLRQIWVFDGYLCLKRSFLDPMVNLATQIPPVSHFLHVKSSPGVQPTLGYLPVSCATWDQ